MEDSTDKIVRDGVRNDYPDYLIKTVTNSPVATACVRRKQSFVVGRGIADQDLGSVMVNEEYDFAELHRKIARDFAFSDRFAVIMIPSRGGELLQMYCVPFEAVRLGVPDEKGNIWYAAVNHKFNTYDYRPSDTMYYPLFSPRVGFGRLRDDVNKFAQKFGADQDYHGHLFFYNRLSEKNRTYSRPDFFSAHDYMLTDFKVGVFHERNVDNNFFLGGVLTVVGDPGEQILDTEGNAYTTVGEEFERQLARTMSGADNTGKWMIDWVRSAEERTVVDPWPGQSNHEHFLAIKEICREVISTSFAIPQVLLGAPTAGKLGDNQEIRNAIKFTNETTEDYRRTLEGFYSMIVELMSGVEVPEDGVMIEKLNDWVDLPEYVVMNMTEGQRREYFADQFGIMTAEGEETQQPNEFDDADLPDTEE